MTAPIAEAVASKVIVKKAGKTVGARAGKIGRKQASSQRLLIVEFVVCIVVLGMQPLVSDVGPAPWMKKGSAVSLLFFILALIGSIGPGSRKVASGFGGLVTVAVLLNERSVFTFITQKMNSASKAPAPYDPNILGGTALGLIGPLAPPMVPPAPVQPPSVLPGTVFR